MKDQPTVFGTTSRRQFTRAAAAALIAAPLIRAAGGQRTAPRSRKSKSMRLPPPPRVHGFTRMLSPGVEEHIPPMTLTDGSLEINCYDRFDNDNGVQIGASTWRYQKSSFGNIKKVMVMVSNELDFTTPYFALIGPPFCDPQNVQIKLWLQEKETASNNYKPIDTTKPPEVVISGTGLLQLDINEQLARRPRSKHPYRPYKYEHEGAGYGQHFRIGAIDISSTNCPGQYGSAHWVTRDFDRYRIQIFGPNIDPNKVLSN